MGHPTARVGFALMLIALTSPAARAQAADDYNVFVRALPANQQQQQLYQQQPQQVHPYQQVSCIEQNVRKPSPLDVVVSA